MSATQNKKIEIIKAATSKINEVDFENLSFGAVFTDHLFECDFKFAPNNCHYLFRGTIPAGIFCTA